MNALARRVTVYVLDPSSTIGRGKAGKRDMWVVGRRIRCAGGSKGAATQGSRDRMR